MRASRILILLILVAIFVDFAMPNEGAFRFNVDESMVGVRSEACAEAPRAQRVDVCATLTGPEASVVVPTVPRARIETARRTVGPPARSRVAAFVDSTNSLEDH